MLMSFGLLMMPVHLKPNQIRKMHPDLFDHQHHNVRACAKGLTVEHCWIRKDAVKNILCDKMQNIYYVTTCETCW